MLDGNQIPPEIMAQLDEEAKIEDALKQAPWMKKEEAESDSYELTEEWSFENCIMPNEVPFQSPGALENADCNNDSNRKLINS